MYLIDCRKNTDKNSLQRKKQLKLHNKLQLHKNAFTFRYKKMAWMRAKIESIHIHIFLLF